MLEYFRGHIGEGRSVEILTRIDIENYKTQRSQAHSQQHPDRRIAPRTINFEISVLRTFFNYLINERGLQAANPCARFKLLRDPRARANRRPPTYTQEELDRLFNVCSEAEHAIFSTFLLTGLREQELCFLTWADLEFASGCEAVHVRCKEGFSPKDYEERVIPIPGKLAKILSAVPRKADWVFPTPKGRRHTHLLRRLSRPCLKTMLVLGCSGIDWRHGDGDTSQAATPARSVLRG